MNDRTIIILSSIISITILEISAIIFLKIDGVLLSTIVGIIAGLAGYHVNTGIKNNGGDENGGNTTNIKTKNR